jgi:hypothetical protein
MSALAIWQQVTLLLVAEGHNWIDTSGTASGDRQANPTIAYVAGGAFVTISGSFCGKIPLRRPGGIRVKGQNCSESIDG